MRERSFRVRAVELYRGRESMWRRRQGGGMDERWQISERQGHEKMEWSDCVKRAMTLPEVELEDGRQGWASPPGNLFLVRGPNYFSKKVKLPSADSLLQPLGVDWLRSNSRLDHVLLPPDHSVRKALDKAHADGDALKSFVLAINLQIPGKDHHSAIFYFVTDEPIRPGSLLYRFIHEDDSFRNSRFKLINRIVRGPWIVKAAAGNHSACLLGKALTCRYFKGPNYLEIDVDIGSSAVANAILHLALGYVNCVAVDMAFVIECQEEEELPERLLGAVRIAQIEMGAAVFVDVAPVAPVAEKGVCGLQANSPWRKLGRSLSYFGKAGKVDAEEDEHQ